MAPHKLQNSKFYANRTDVRAWHELKSISGGLWSWREENKMRADCLSTTDAVLVSPPRSSNATVWAAAFERYGVPLSDLFTYGLKPHPDSTRGPRGKQLTPLCCQLLSEVLVHPIFQAKIGLVRYALQRIICLRMGAHELPLGPVPDDMDDRTCTTIFDAAEATLTDNFSETARIQATHDTVWLYMQEHGMHKHPEIVKLQDALMLAFEVGDVPPQKPNNYTPHCGRLFLLQLWDLQFLVQVLNNMASTKNYLRTDKYYRQWLDTSDKVRPFIIDKYEKLVEDWFLHDERNYRVRQKLKRTNPDRILYDIAEEDFQPLYYLSKYITEGMRAILRGDYLTAVCLPTEEDINDWEMQAANEGDESIAGESESVLPCDEDEMFINSHVVVQGTNQDVESIAGESEYSLSSNESLPINENVDMHPVERDIDRDATEVDATYADDILEDSSFEGIIYEDATNEGAANEDLDMFVREVTNLSGSDDEYVPSAHDSDGEAEDNTETVLNDQPGGIGRSTSIVSVFSITSTDADDWEPNDDGPAHTENEHIAKRGMTWENRSKPAFRRRQDHIQDKNTDEMHEQYEQPAQSINDGA